MIRSKAGVTTAELGDQYCMLGPYNEETVKLEVEILEPEFPIMKESIEALRKEGVKVCMQNNFLCVCLGSYYLIYFFALSSLFFCTGRFW